MGRGETAERLGSGRGGKWAGVDEQEKGSGPGREAEGGGGISRYREWDRDDGRGYDGRAVARKPRAEASAAGRQSA